MATGTMVDGQPLAKQNLGLIHCLFCVGHRFQFLKVNTKMSWGGKQSPQAFCAQSG